MGLKRMVRTRALLVLLSLLAPIPVAAFDAYLGDYVGQWNTEVTADPYDDISRYDLEESVMRLHRVDGELRLTFFLDAEAAAADPSVPVDRAIAAMELEGYTARRVRAMGLSLGLFAVLGMLVRRRLGPGARSGS